MIYLTGDKQDYLYKRVHYFSDKEAKIFNDISCYLIYKDTPSSCEFKNEHISFILFGGYVIYDSAIRSYP